MAQSQINLAPKASALSLQDELALQHTRSISPTNATVNGDFHMELPPTSPSAAAARSRTSSHDGLTGSGGGSGNRSRSNTSGSVGHSRTNSGSIVNGSSNPGGSADTRRRITKLSKAREREKAPRLVEYFCVVSSVAINSGGVEVGSDGGGNDGYAENSGNVRPPGSPSRGKSVTRVEPMPQTPGKELFHDNNNNAASKSATATLDGSEFQPQITARYPLEDHEDNPLLPESITAFCFPSGKIPIIASEGNDTANNMPKVHYFVTTGESGQKMYGTCLTVWEGHDVTLEEKKKSIDSSSSITQSVYLPKCLVILSMHPYLVAFREYLTQLHRQSKMAPPTNGESNMIGSIISTTNTSNSTLKQVLTLPIERYITNFCSELPAPPPGSFQVQTTILDSVISIWSPPHNMPIAWVSLPFSHLFQCLDVENVLKVWTALALERQVLVTSTQLSLLTTCCEILLSLLFPMKWSHAYIPVLPHFLVPILSAPMPFLCGIDKRHLASAMDDLSDECIVVDLDKNMVSLGVKTAPLPRLPKYIYQRLKNKVENNAGHVHREVRSLRKVDNTSEMGIYLPPDVKSMADAMWESRLCLFDEAFMLMFTPEERRKNWLNGDDGGSGSNDPKANLLMTLSEKQNLRSQSQWDAVQEAFLETYCFLLQKYRKFLSFPSKQNEGAYGGAGFRSQEFLASQRSDVREFSEEVVGSQMFDDFVTKRLYGSGEADISFFDTAVDRYVRNNGLVANVRGMVRESSGGVRGDAGSGSTPLQGSVKGGIRKMFGGRGGSGPAPPPHANGEKDPPLLQSARVKRELKTIVPPEPCGVDLPDNEEGIENAMVVHVTTKREEVVPDESDDVSIASASTTASKLDSGRVYYHYPTFPEQLDPNLFGEPRPMSSAVRAEYDRQREKVGKFRRTTSTELEAAGLVEGENSRRSSAISGQAGTGEKPATSEVTTFTVFFMTFTAVVGKDLMAVDNDSLDQLDSKSIISTYARPKKEKEAQREDESRHIASLVDEIVMDADLPQTPTKKERPRPERATPVKTPVRNRFNDKLSTLKIMEAKETSKAELVIAFEMLKMMKERGLRADPEAYQCLIDACGRCGDTGCATQLLSRMHEDGIVADGVVYSSLVSAFSAENAWKQASGEVREELPAWANGASIDMDWNTLKAQKRSYIDIVKEKLGATDENGDHPAGLRDTFNRWRNKGNQTEKKDASNTNTYTEQFVTDQVLRQILLGESLLEVVYPDISIDTDNEFCPRCNFYLSDDDVVAGWSAGNSQEYKTECPNCLTKFVPHFCVQSTLPSFMGSRGPASALFCERLSPWVLKKELRSVISGGIEDLLSTEWRERESKNAVLWWNLILSFMRFRFPFTFLLQGSFSSSLIAPTPDDEENLDSM
eukprot:CAMPEP_0201947094 /NCGR_PEP_ID=MMETSP0903-20130614/54759_1 /ASSEMBLY_ACC=CAM_ASM_000552 /TAXON_ID=420261 /ORGANISM="Thalassiosira antarctica, Strain CCMP982" /LENGTH=1385 /DNA_ID=CAMNT_0048490219 /DNA_START=26 /DNA_END=4183 /DNA_ORIENTATION=+